MNSLSLYQSVKMKDHNLGDFIEEIPINPLSYTSVTIPSSNLLLLDDGFMNVKPPFEIKIVLDNDTIPIYKNHTSKKPSSKVGFGFYSKWVYMITE